MSDYVHNKVVRLPFPKEILTLCNTNVPYNCESYLRGLLGDLYSYRTKKHFTIEYTDDRTYIDWVYYTTYGEESGDYGFARLLTQKELDVIKPIFNKLLVEYKDEDLRIVDYCYYNRSEAPDYYEINDESNLLI